MPCAVHKQGIVCASGDNQQMYVHQQQNCSSGELVELFVNVSFKFA
jgi:hypothetical protein